MKPTRNYKYMFINQVYYMIILFKIADMYAQFISQTPATSHLEDAVT